MRLSVCHTTPCCMQGARAQASSNQCQGGRCAHLAELLACRGHVKLNHAVHRPALKAVWPSGRHKLPNLHIPALLAAHQRHKLSQSMENKRHLWHAHRAIRHAELTLWMALARLQGHLLVVLWRVIPQTRLPQPVYPDLIAPQQVGGVQHKGRHIPLLQCKPQPSAQAPKQLRLHLCKEAARSAVAGVCMLQCCAAGYPVQLCSMKACGGLSSEGCMRELA